MAQAHRVGSGSRPRRASPRPTAARRSPGRSTGRVRRVRSAGRGTGAGATGASRLPTWDLSDLYAGVDDPAIARDLQEVLRRAQAFHDAHAGRWLSGSGIEAGAVAAATREYESIVELASKVAAYAQLLHEADTSDPRHGALLASVMQQLTQAQSLLMFFDLEWMDLPDEEAGRLLADAALAHYRPYLTFARRFRPHKLSEPQEQVVNQLANTGSRAWQRFFDEFTAGMRFRVQLDGAARRVRELGQSETLALLHEPRRSTRRAAARALTEGLRAQERTLAYVFNTLLWDAQIDDELRSYRHPMASRHLSNMIDEQSVEALMSAAEAGYAIVQRYYRLKARVLGLKRLADYDRYAPLDDAAPEVDWSAARDTVLEAFGRFDPRMREIAARFFEGRWIDAGPRPGKSGGAFCAATVPAVHPYVLMNYTGKLRDVMTLAHELGHGVHQYLSRGRGMLQMSTPLTLAETASVFAEMLVFEKLLAGQSDPRARLGLLCGKIEDVFATVFRQIAMTRFEQRIHEARRREGELPVEAFNRYWIETNRAMFGDALELTDGYGWWWSYVPHFVRSPFYCYAYAFGELLVIALYRLYQTQGPSFVPKYLDLLAAGGTGTPEELLRPLGIDIRAPEFWSRGVEFIDGLVRQAEALAATGGARGRVGWAQRRRIR